MTVFDKPVERNGGKTSKRDELLDRPKDEDVSNQRAESTADRSDTTEVPPDAVFDILRNDRRRAVLRYLKRRDARSATLDEMATHIAGRENDVDVSRVSSTQRKRVYVALYQSHLPKMDDVGIIDYDRNRGIIEPKGLSHLEPHLSIIDGNEQGTESWLVVFGILVASGLLLALGRYTIGPLGFVTGDVWVAILICAMVGFVTCHTVRDS